MRVKIPWVDALAQSQEQAQTGASKTQEEKPLELDLTPKRMSDSYFSAVSQILTFMQVVRRYFLLLTIICQVLPLAEDKWLLDTYLNASGRIR
jgi:acyl-coenzyme A thioesterase 9